MSIGMLKACLKTCASLAQQSGKSIKDVTRKDIGDKHHGTINSLELASKELNEICKELVNRLNLL